MNSSTSNAIVCTGCHQRNSSSGCEESSSTTIAAANVSSAAPLVQTTTMPLPSLFSTLFDIMDKFSCTTDKIDANNKLWIEWIIQQCCNMDEQCREYANSRLENARVVQTKSAIEEKRRKARQVAFIGE